MCVQSQILGDALEWMDRFALANHRGLDRLAAAIFVRSTNPEDRYMAMFKAYFDASGNGIDQPLIIVSGYVANYLQWKNLEDLWDRIHAEFGANKPFHMADFMAALNNPGYKNQKNARADYVNIAATPEKANRFLKALVYAQSVSMVCGISSIVPMKLYNEVNSIHDLRSVIPPYALGARMCIQRLHRWEKDYAISDPVEYIFESGDFEQGKFTDLMVDEGEQIPIYKNKADFAGLQAADHYAWEQFNFLKRHSFDAAHAAAPTFGMLLDSIPKLHTNPTPQLLVDLCRAKKIGTRS